MPKWFVYVDKTYYPWAETVEADTPEEAVRLAGGADERVSVFPADARAYFNDPHAD